MAFFIDLKSKNEEIQLLAAEKLKEYVTSSTKELSGESLSRFSNDINRRIFELIHSHDSHERLGGIIAIGKLIEVESEGDVTNLTRYANYLRMTLPNTNFHSMEVCAQVLGNLAATGGTIAADFVEFEVQRAFEWLQGDRNEPKRMAAVLVLRELAIHSPTLVYVYVSDIFPNLWAALRDPKPVIRETAADALGATLDVVCQREAKVQLQCFSKVLMQAEYGLKQASVEQLHGSLLAYKELFEKSGSFISGHYQNFCELVLKLREHRDGTINRTLLLLIPTLAEYNPTQFRIRYLDQFMVFLLQQIKKDRDKEQAFSAIGRIALAVGEAIVPYLQTTLQLIKKTLTAKVRGKTSYEKVIFECIGQLAAAVKLELFEDSRSLLGLIFSCEISEHLRDALEKMAANIPPLLAPIQERLLNMVSQILTGKEFEIRPDDAYTPCAADYISLHQPVDTTQGSRQIIIALEILGSFNFEGYSLVSFVQESVLPYLENDNADVRVAAARTCCQVFGEDPICLKTTPLAIESVAEVLEKLLTLAIADANPRIRQTVLSLLDERFDRHLAQPENIRCLFIALNDELFNIREIAIVIIGRLAHYNPAHVMPSLRKTIIQLLSDLEYSGNSRHKEESARLLRLLVSTAKKLIKPYIHSITQALLPKARDQSPSVSSAVISALGELAYVAGEDISNSVRKSYMSLILQTLQDQNSVVKRLSALKALRQFCGGSGYVIQPYLDYPSLLSLLIDILRSEQPAPIRREVLRTIGVLGALDPYKYLSMWSQEEEEVFSSRGSTSESTLLNPFTQSGTLEFYASVSVSVLMVILKDPSLSMHHSSVVQAVMHICSHVGSKSFVFLPQVIPTYLHVMQSLSPSSSELYFQQLATLTTIVGPKIRDYVSNMFNVAKVFWDGGSSLLVVILNLIEAIAEALADEFKFYLPQILSYMLTVFDTDTTPTRVCAHKVLHAFVVFQTSIEEYMHLVLPVVVRTFERETVPLALRKSAIKCIADLLQTVNFSDHASRVIHPLVRILSKGNQEMKMATMDTLCAFVTQLGYDYAIFIPTVNKALSHQKVQHAAYDLLVSRLLKGEPLPKDLMVQRTADEIAAQQSRTLDENIAKLPVDQGCLRAAWETSQKLTRDDWQEWIRRLSVELLKESPSHALRACSSLAGVYHPLSRDLFNVAFLSCWNELSESNRRSLVKSMETAMNAPNLPTEILQTLLNLAEYMERECHALPISPSVLSGHASRCNFYAKALHYKELQFIEELSSEVSINTIETLITINNCLQQPDAAIGMLRYAKQNNKLELRETWYEKLHRWDDALAAYTKRESEENSNFETTLGKLRCYQALGEWDQLSDLAQTSWKDAKQEQRESLAPLAAAAAWGLGQWGLINKYVGAMDREPQDKEFFSIIDAVYTNHTEKAFMHMERLRDILVTDLASIIGESYNRAYPIIVKSQMLSELEEIIEVKQSEFDEVSFNSLKRTWMKRLDGCQHDVDIWHHVLNIRALIIRPKESPEMWIKLVNLCRRSDRLTLASQCLSHLVGESSLDNIDFEKLKMYNSHIAYAYLKCVWANGKREEALNHLSNFTSYLAKTYGYDEETMGQRHDLGLLNIRDTSNDDLSFLAHCYNKQGKWKKLLDQDLSVNNADDILNCYYHATICDKSWYKAWHSWALANFEVVGYYEQAKPALFPSGCESNIISAIKGFFNSSVLSPKNSLQDILRLLNLWFRFGDKVEVDTAINEGFSVVPMDMWLEVIPQLIARIHTPSTRVRKSVHQLLTDIGRAHPQALVYSLTVSAKSTNVHRKNSAQTIMESMLAHSGELYRQALLVSGELIRVAILWHEIWYEGLEDASRAFFSERDPMLMIETLKPIHEVLEKGPETLSEISFASMFGYDLQRAKQFWLRYLENNDMMELNQAWDLYYQVFKKIQKQLPRITEIELQYVSPKLLEARDLELAMPGTYKHNKPIIRISRFCPTFKVISSKQRPRRLTIHGSDGREYQYALKGHEDLRQDERVIQLFGLCNTLLTMDNETFKRRLSIDRYPVIPLSPNSGLIGWDYRESKNVLLNQEHRLMLQMAPDLDSLTVLQKLEVFEYALQNTDGRDLYHVLWLNSRNSEVWLDRRTNYTRSLAVMSMVGYILGLGDRHPSNLLMDRITGKIVHIDFGDCFEVAMFRDKYPEKIPFRLTRMLINAMEVSGIEGSFRITCEHVMHVLRSNAESLMAVLEAFIYDPLINWRLMTKRPNDATETSSTRVQTSSIEEKGRSWGRRLRSSMFTSAEDAEQDVDNEGLNQRSLQVLKRVSNKLTGRDFDLHQKLTVKDQVAKLIQQATDHENLCQCYVGWCSFW
ncbi:phosphatidylinositol kinase Tor1 [Schizosaccharomyces japonicus yFS275]|uniref:Serine/threonine-protein kinase TOR n=1 Tax=Schizosaccharomyces japonicus (strain yFS275 / FY16936) TaxID=402676 RepID=B6K384_SCHJY|nr:phosphatidylinositol kinase Tor1 [Schizosaccharomyces japonicus yFS275]EEB07941.2 phosphatidylinositol kinase Tor1 [Schizosaccharomyces japonicus yFS275]